MWSGTKQYMIKHKQLINPLHIVCVLTPESSAPSSSCGAKKVRSPSMISTHFAGAPAFFALACSSAATSVVEVPEMSTTAQSGCEKGCCSSVTPAPASAAESAATPTKVRPSIVFRTCVGVLFG